MTHKKNIPADAEIDSIDIKNEKLTTKTRQKNHTFFKKNIP